MISTHAGFLDALFEAISAVTTTGLTTLPSLEGLPASFHFTRSWMQWFGGLGIVTLSIALLGSARLPARKIALPDAEDSLLPEGVRTRARHAIVVYTTLTVIGIVALFAAGATPIDSVVHALSGVSTGGFSSHDDSLASTGGWPVQAAAVGLGLCGAVALPVYARLLGQGPGAIRDDIELRALIGSCLSTSVLLGIALVVESQLSLESALRNAPLIATSAQTTTGFTPMEISELGPTAKLLVIASMLTGGSVGSTAGGVKLLRVLVTFRLLGWAVSRTRFAPHAVSDLHLAGEPLSPGGIQRILVVVILFLVTVAASWLPFVASGYDPLDALFEVASAVATTGLSVGIARPELEAPLKMVLCADMLLGRVEVLALLVLFSPGTWRGRRAT
jgi:trk system potassium uptake protein TrkH